MRLQRPRQTPLWGHVKRLSEAASNAPLRPLTVEEDEEMVDAFSSHRSFDFPSRQSCLYIIWWKLGFLYSFADTFSPLWDVFCYRLHMCLCIRLRCTLHYIDLCNCNLFVISSVRSRSWPFLALVGAELFGSSRSGTFLALVGAELFGRHRLRVLRFE